MHTTWILQSGSKVWRFRKNKVRFCFRLGQTKPNPLQLDTNFTRDAFGRSKWWSHIFKLICTQHTPTYRRATAPVGREKTTVTGDPRTFTPLNQVPPGRHLCLLYDCNLWYQRIHWTSWRVWQVSYETPHLKTHIWSIDSLNIRGTWRVKSSWYLSFLCFCSVASSPYHSLLYHVNPNAIRSKFVTSLAAWPNPASCWSAKRWNGTFYCTRVRNVKTLSPLVPFCR